MKEKELEGDLKIKGRGDRRSDLTTQAPTMVMEPNEKHNNIAKCRVECKLWHG